MGIGIFAGTFSQSINVVSATAPNPSTGGRAASTAKHEVETSLQFHTRNVRDKEFRLHQVSLFRR